MVFARLIFAVVISGALIFGTGSQASEIPLPELPVNYLQLPIVRQANDYSCGPAALLSVLNYWQAYEGTEASLYRLLQTTKKDGTEPTKLVAVAKKFGLEAEMRDRLEVKDLREALDRGDTVILSLQAWRDEVQKPLPWKDTWDEGHYVVLIAMDSNYIYVMDPSGPMTYVYVPVEEFIERWHDFEDRHGYVWKYQHLGVIIRGKKSNKKFPGELARMG